jgi:hypothetical protein
MKRPPLKAVPLGDVLPMRPGRLHVTMRVGQWDVITAAAYDMGAVLLELDVREEPIGAYWKGEQR